MLYHLNRGLFVENGPTVLAERTREALAVSSAYLLLGTPKPTSGPKAETSLLRTAA